MRVDTKTGAVTKIGTLGQIGFASSGDIVSVKGGATYLTVRGTDCGDCLVEVNPATGAIVKQWGSLGHDQVHGIAFWAGSVYGFDNAGELFAGHVRRRNAGHEGHPDPEQEGRPSVRWRGLDDERAGRSTALASRRFADSRVQCFFAP